MKNNGPWLAALALAAAMPVAADDWIAWRPIDRMTGEEEVFGVYAATRPEEPHPSVYADIEGLLIIECEVRDFVIAHELYAGTVIGSAYLRLIDSEGSVVEFMMLPGPKDWYKIRARFDNETVLELPTFTVYTNRRRGRQIRKRTSPMFPNMLLWAEGRHQVRLEVPSVEGDLYFDFSLTGLHEAHRENCG